jgi:hypothetical protein
MGLDIVLRQDFPMVPDMLLGFRLDIPMGQDIQTGLDMLLEFPLLDILVCFLLDFRRDIPMELDMLLLLDMPLVHLRHILLGSRHDGQH